MHLRVIVAANWTVVAPVDARGRCRVMEDLDALRRTDTTARAQLTALLERVAREAPQRDPQRSRYLGSGIYELKTVVLRTQGVRSQYLAARDAHDIVTEDGSWQI